MHIVKIFLAGSFGILAACSNTANETAQNADLNAPWTLSAAESGMTYITVKNNDIGEINTFREISGSVSSNGEAVFEVHLDSVDTNNETRDPRMREHMFRTAEFPTATVKAQVDMAQFENLPVGDSATVLLDTRIELAGMASEESYYVLVTRLGENKVSVTNKAPFVLDAEMLGMSEGLETLRNLAGLDSISPVVPVTVSLVFERQ